jgi:hypothetical protein
MIPAMHSTWRVLAFRFRRFVPTILAVTIAAFALSSCYLPGSFDAEIELSRTGFYKMTFDGYIVDVSLYDDLRQGKLTQKQQEEKIANTITDFKRDGDTKEVSYYGQGAFKVVWQTSGDITRTKQVVFFRRNENMLSITYDEKDGTIDLAGKYIKKQDADRIIQMGLNIQGVLRVKTDAHVIAHNAQRVTKDGLTTIYGFQLNSVTDPSPRMKVAL